MTEMMRANSRMSTPPHFDDRFFFEVVQHCGGYQQYGAANAAARMAAQTQRHSVSRLNGLLA